MKTDRELRNALRKLRGEPPEPAPKTLSPAVMETLRDAMDKEMDRLKREINSDVQASTLQPRDPVWRTRVEKRLLAHFQDKARFTDAQIIPSPDWSEVRVQVEVAQPPRPLFFTIPFGDDDDA